MRLVVTKSRLLLQPCLLTLLENPTIEKTSRLYPVEADVEVKDIGFLWKQLRTFSMCAGKSSKKNEHCYFCSATNHNHIPFSGGAHQFHPLPILDDPTTERISQDIFIIWWERGGYQPTFI